jgi:hypothetical protein
VLVVELTVFDPPEAKLKRRPYSVRLHTEDATAEQLVSGITLLGILGDRLTKLTKEKYPGAIDSFLRGDEVLKYGKGQVTGVEDSEGSQVPREAPDDDKDGEDASTRRRPSGTLQGTDLDR